MFYRSAKFFAGKTQLFNYYSKTRLLF